MIDEDDSKITYYKAMLLLSTIISELYRNVIVNVTYLPFCNIRS